MHNKSTYHYAYRITNLVERKHYYGKRSSSIIPMLDLGVRYFSSSCDHAFRTNQIENPDHYRYKVIRVFNTPKQAINFEIKLHKRFNVNSHPAFYNRAMQISTGFDTTGAKLTPDTLQKLKDARDNRSLDDKIKIRQKQSRSHRNKPQQEKDLIRQKIKTTIDGRSPAERIALSQKLSNSSKNRPLVSDETIQKMRAAAAHRPTMSEQTRQKISATKLNKSPEEKAMINQHRSSSIANRSLTDTTKIVQKQKQTMALRSPEEKALSKLKRSEASKNRKPITAETREKLRKARAKQIMMPRSAETKEKLRNANLGKHHTDETKVKLSDSVTGRKYPIVICPHCGTNGARNARKWHFDNCKEKI